MIPKSIYALLISSIAGIGSCQSPDTPISNPSARQPAALQDSLVQVRVTAVDFGIASIAAWDCETFDPQAPDATITVITDPVTLARIHQRVTHLREDPYKVEVDTRAKAVLQYADGHSNIICVGSRTMEKDCEPVYYDSRLSALLALDVY